MTFPTPTPSEEPESVIIAWQDDEIKLLRAQLQATRTRLVSLARLGLEVVSDTTPAGMGSEQETQFRNDCSRIVEAMG